MPFQLLAGHRYRVRNQAVTDILWLQLTEYNTEHHRWRAVRNNGQLTDWCWAQNGVFRGGNNPAFDIVIEYDIDLLRPLLLQLDLSLATHTAVQAALAEDPT